MDNLNPPRVLIESNTVGLNESVRLDSLFTVFDDDAFSEVVEYQIRNDVEGGGFFTQGGQPLTPSAGDFITIPGDQIGTIRYVGGNSIATETISIRAFDGVFRSDLALGFITTGNSRPVVTANQDNFVVSVGSRTSIADLVQFSDAENNPDVFYFIVDRTFGANGGQIIGPQDDIPNLQATFLFVDGFDLAATTYEAPSVGGESETISVRAFDGFSFSETVDFTITTGFGPTIIDNGQQAVTTGERRAVTELFSLDEDAEAIIATETFFIVDRRANAGGGFFEFRGERQTSAEFFKVQADELDEVFYVGGSDGADIENIGIVGFNGLELGETVDIEVITQPSPVVADTTRTVRAGHFLNFATGGTANVSGTVPESDEPIFDFLDSGANIVEYLFADRRTNGGNFVFRGQTIPSAQFFLVPGDELDQLEYVGGQTGPFSEDIGVLVNTNFVWTQLDDFTINTIPNATAPIVTAPDITVRPGSVLPLESLFGFTDAEGDSLATITIQDNDFDTVADPDNGVVAFETGAFEINGVRQAAGIPIVVPFDQFGTVNYVASPSASSGDIEISVNDFLNDSEVATSTITSVGVPIIEGNQNDIRVDTIERILVSDQISQIDSGPVPTRYQVFDENVAIRSGGFELDGVALPTGVVQDLTADEYSRLFFTGAEVDNGRQLNSIIVRANDGSGTGFGEWERVNVNTDPIGTAALISGFSLADDDVVDVDAGISQALSDNFNVITFTFLDGGNQNGGGASGPILPAYFDPEEAIGMAGAMGDIFALSQEQREAVRDVFDFYEQLIDVTFVELPFPSIDTNAEVVIGAYPVANTGRSDSFFPDDNLSGVGSQSSDFFYGTDFGDFDPNTPTDVSFGSEFNFETHRLVTRVLGLNTPFAAPDPAGPNAPAIFTPLSIFNNFTYLSIQASQQDSVFNRFEPYPEPPTTASLFDVEELQRLYNPNPDFNSGDNQYGNFFSGSAPHFVNNDEQHQTTLYDAGGTDTLNYTLHVADETIDLRQGTFSSINGVPQSLRISYDTVIENARGGSGDDNLRGNETANFLIGNGGDDVLFGGGGNDALRGGEGDDTYVWNLGDGRDFVQELAEGGLDTLQVFDVSGTLSSLEDDLTFRRFGNDLRIDFTFDQNAGQGTVTIDDFGDETSRVEFLTIHDASGAQIGDAVDLQSIFDQATTLAQRFAVGTELATTLEVADGDVNENAFAAIAAI